LTYDRHPDSWVEHDRLHVGRKLMLLVINLPLVGMWVRRLKVPYRLMFLAILMFCAVGISSINSLPTDVMFIGFLGLVGYMLIKFGFEPAPLLLGFVLGKLMERTYGVRSSSCAARWRPSLPNLGWGKHPAFGSKSHRMAVPESGDQPVNPKLRKQVEEGIIGCRHRCSNLKTA
jgi:Tripartite tricarboxylate transporter TctA family